MMNQYLLLALITVNLALFFFLYWQPRKKRKQQASGLFFESSRGPIYYSKNGKSKETVLLLHGLGASLYSWRMLIPLLEKDFNVIACDLWGFGKSTKENHHAINLDEQVKLIFELLDALKINKVHVIGNSMGGHIGFWMAKTHPERVLKLVPIAPATAPKIVPGYLKKVSWISKFTPFVVNHNMVRGMLINVFGNPHNVNAEMVDAYLEPYLDRQSHLSFASALEILRDERVYNSLEEIENPTLLLWGERDRVISEKIINSVTSKLPHVQLKTHPKSGHSPMEEHPEWCAELIIPFLKS